MGLMRKVESRIEDAVGAGPQDGPSGKPPDAGSKKKSRLHVQPDELARKLVKEMEARKSGRSTGSSVPNRYTVYLCPEDFARLESRRDEVEVKLERHLAKHVHSKRYEVMGDITVSLVLDPDLKLGHFGLLAQRTGEESPVGPTKAMPVVTAAAAAPSMERAASPGQANLAGGTAVIRPAEAEEYGLVRQTIVLKAGSLVREFNHGRVIVGRAKDVDFQVDDPNVSRRHAAIYWADGSLMVTDLDSTNGTMVNGYPVTNSVLRPHDVVTIGDCRITVDTR
jgi:FhaA, N-terminal domain/FHA domain